MIMQNLPEERRTSDPTPERRTAASVWRDFPSVAARISNRQAALTEMARLIANQLDVDVCSIYECDDSGLSLIHI